MDELLPKMATNITGANVHRGTQPVTASTPSPSTPLTDAPRSASSSSKRKLIEFDTFGSGISGQSNKSGISGISGQSGPSGQSSAGKKRKNTANEVATAVDSLTTVYGDIKKTFDSPSDARSKAAVRLEQIIEYNTWLTDAQRSKLVLVVEKDVRAASVLAMSSRDSGLEKAWVRTHLGLDSGSQD
jgi:hypothetical protein